jgi:hypothetical protein
MPQPANLSGWRNRRAWILEGRPSGILLTLLFLPVSIAPRSRKEPAQSTGRGPFKACRSPNETMSSTEYCIRRLSAAHCALKVLSWLRVGRNQGARFQIVVSMHRLTSNLLNSGTSFGNIRGPEPFMLRSKSLRIALRQGFCFLATPI